MADNVVISAGTGTTVAADEVVDGTLGTVKAQYIKIMDGTLDGTTKAAVGARGLAVDIAAAAAAIAKAEDVASADADVGVPAMAVRKATPANTSGTDGDYEMLQVSAGRLWTNSLVGDGTNAVAVKAASTAPAATDPAFVVGISPNSWDAGSGTGGSKTQRVIMDSSQISGVGQNTMSASTPVVLPSDQTVTVKGTATSNGLTKSRVNAANSTNATSLKASAGNVFSYKLFNNAAYAVFVKMYNKASAPTVGTDTPVWTIPIPAGGGFSDNPPIGDAFSTGIAYAITKLQADSDTTVVAAGDVTGKIEWF